MPLTDYIIIFVPLFVLIALLETVLSAMWIPFYMRLGLPVWRQSARLLTKEQFWQAVARLDGTELDGTWYPTVAFKRLSPNELAFRRKLRETKVGIRFRVPIRGIVRLTGEAYTVTITNYLPWTSPAALLIFLWLFSSFNRLEFNDSRAWFFGVFLLLILVFTVGLQLVVFRQINNRILAQIDGQSYTK